MRSNWLNRETTRLAQAPFQFARRSTRRRCQRRQSKPSPATRSLTRLESYAATQTAHPANPPGFAPAHTPRRKLVRGSSPSELPSARGRSESSSLQRRCCCDKDKQSSLPLRATRIRCAVHGSRVRCWLRADSNDKSLRVLGWEEMLSASKRTRRSSSRF